MNINNYLLPIVGLLIMIFSFVIIILGSGTEVIGETPCVDGKNRINLEGIMCEDKVERFFGQHPSFILIMVIPALLFVLLTVWCGRNDAEVSGDEVK